MVNRHCCWPRPRPLAVLLGGLMGSTALCVAHAQSPLDAQPAPIPFGSVVRPAGVVSTSGDVSGAGALVSGGSATLTYDGRGAAPQIILDYGRDVGGLPVFDVASASGSPTLSASYSETQHYLLPAGDGDSFVDGLGVLDAFRTDTFTVNGPGVITNTLVQGGERFELITLTSPGTVTLSGAGVKSLAYAPPAGLNTGRFTSSDPTLNEIWDIGARTLQNDQLGVGVAPATFVATTQGSDTQPGAGLMPYLPGAALRDYTAAFDVQVTQKQATWVLRGSIPVTITGAGDDLAAPNSLIVGAVPGPAVVSRIGAKTPSAVVPLGLTVAPGEWHHVSSTISGGTLTVSIDGQQVTSVAVRTGRGFGFYNGPQCETLLRDVVLTDASGNQIASLPMTSVADTSEFAANTNVLPSVLDGAKRDRLVWAGDLSIAGPSTYYSSGASQFLKGSIELYGQFQRSTGEVSSALPPQLLPSAVTGDALSTPDAYYSLSYSTYFVNNLADYYLFTGDLGLVAQEWPVVVKELSYLDANRNAAGLLVTNAADGNDWHPQDHKPEAGTVSEFNVLGIHTLRSAATLASALGNASLASSLNAEADAQTTALNASLFDASLGLYDVSDTLRGFASEDVNVLSVLYGIADPSKNASILANVQADLGTPHGVLSYPASSGLESVISPFINGFDVYARFASGDAEGALNLIRATWGNVLPGTSIYTGAAAETLLADGTPAFAGNTSLSHGWSSAPTGALSRYVLGVAPTSPGFATFTVAPEPGDLSYAAGTVPTPHGPIGVAWAKVDTRLILVATVPAGTTGSVVLPTNGASVLVNDTAVPAKAATTGGARALEVDGLRAGQYRIVVQTH